MEAFLRFVVEEELEGRGEALGQRLIAVKALGRRENFDPKTDPVVRVFASRLRAALARYYEGEGADDPIRIVIARGSYRPAFLYAGKQGHEPDVARPREEPDTVSHPGGMVYLWRAQLLGILLAIAILATGILALQQAVWTRVTGPTGEAPFVPSLGPSGIPVVEVWPFEAGAGDSVLVEGIRQQLIFDLSHFRSLWVRQLPPGGPGGTDLHVTQPSDYRIAGSVIGKNGGGKLELRLRDMENGRVVWAEAVDLPENDAEYQSTLLTTVRSVVTHLAAASGVILTEEISRLEKRAGNLSDTETNEYECVAAFYGYDLKRTHELESEARSCLERLTAADSRNSAVWSSWAMMRYFDWERAGERQDTVPLRESLAASEKAAGLDPDDANVYEARALVYTVLGEQRAARDAFEQAIALNPSKPDLYSRFGSHYIFFGDWRRGIDLVRQGIDMSPVPPGWMRIPLSMDAFRRDDFREALLQAQMAVAGRDRRALVLALAAAAALDDKGMVRRYREELEADGRGTLGDPMREIRAVFPDSELIAKYEDALGPFSRIR
jgi:tetratricopeptide (TPR) repeat protein